MDTEFKDFLTDLPDSVIETILIKLPIKDAIRTSILCSKWRYKWTSITELNLNDESLCENPNLPLLETDPIIFISQLLLLHHGPIIKFTLLTTYIQPCPEVDQWLLFLSRKDIKELAIELGEGGLFKAPSSLFLLQNLTRLELVRCVLDPPSTFQGFPYLTELRLLQTPSSSHTIENLIAGCPLLQRFSLSYYDNLRGSNLKYFYKILGGVPSFQRFLKHFDYRKCTSIGNHFGTTQMQFTQLKFIEVFQVSFAEYNDTMAVLQLVSNAPYLEELHIHGTSIASYAEEAPDIKILGTERLCSCTLLKMVKLTNLNGVLLERRLIEVLLRKSPVLRSMRIIPNVSMKARRLGFLIDLVRFRRASAEAEIIFGEDET